MSPVTLRRRLLELERFDAPAGLLPVIVDDDVPDAAIEQMRRQGRNVARLHDFVDSCT
jgi:hypothetical protein